MTCKRCACDKVKEFNGELAIHFPGLEGLEKPIVWVFPELVICLGCGLVQFVLSDEELAQLKNGGFTAQSPYDDLAEQPQ
jgi:hypothetical protein